MSVFAGQQGTICDFPNSDTWVILSPIEQSIKRKIELVGTPLKDWDIDIYRGVLTGCNEAFIISTAKREEILNNCKSEDERNRTAELIRAILRGRDIKRYSYNWAGRWLIYIPWHFPYQFDECITGASEKAEKAFKEQYPTVYAHMVQYKETLSKRNQAETGIRYEWYALQRWGANYWEDFSKHKIAWASVGETYYSLVEKDMMLLDTNYFFSIKNEVYAYYLLGILNSRLVTFWINSEDTQIGGGGAYRHYKYNLEKICIPIVQEVSIFNDIVEQILRCVKEKKDSSIYVNELNKQVYLLYNLTQDECDFIDSALKEDKQTHHLKDYIIHR